MEDDPLAALEDDMAELNAPAAVLVTEEDDGSIAVSDVAGDEIEDDHAIALLIKGLFTMLAPVMASAMEELDDQEDDEDA